MDTNMASLREKNQDPDGNTYLSSPALRSYDKNSSILATQTLSQECAIPYSKQAAVKPKVYLSGREAFVWDVNDVRILRQSNRILGSLAGSLPRSSMQNIFQGLPLRLSPEEVYSLWSSGFIDLVNENKSYYQSPQSAKIKVEDIGSASVTKEKSHEYITLQTTATDLSHFSFVGVESFNERNLNKDSKDKSTDITRIVVRDNSIVSWEYPTTHQERLHCLAFNLLWSSYKFFIAPGMKFGGDYLLYRNDPLICHASMIASVVDADMPISLVDLASKARLATTVQKQHLLCSPIQQQSLNPQRVKLQSMSKNAITITVEWAGF